LDTGRLLGKAGPDCEDVLATPTPCLITKA